MSTPSFFEVVNVIDVSGCPLSKAACLLPWAPLEISDLEYR